MTEREKALEAALRELKHAVCGETGFAACVRLDTGMAYPWPALDAAEASADAALALPASIDRASWEAGRDAAAEVCEKKAESMARAGSETLEGAYTIAAEAIRSLTPPQEEAP